MPPCALKCHACYKRRRVRMRLKTLENQMRVFMNPHDYQTMLDAARNRRARLAMRLMGDCSFRVGELLELIRGTMRESTHPDVELYFWPIYGKDTKDRDTQGKIREVWVPEETKDVIDEYARIENISEGEPIFRAAKRTLQKDVTRSRENAVAKTGIDGFQHVSAHDFRAYFATNLALRENVKEEIVMELGGWDDRSTFRNAYLNAQFDDLIQMHLSMAGVVEAETDTVVTEYQMLRNEVSELKDMLSDIEFEPEIHTQVVDPKRAGTVPSDPDKSSLDEFVD